MAYSMLVLLGYMGLAMENADALSEIGTYAAEMVTRPGITAKDAVKIGAAFLVAAEEIFTAVGGKKMASAQFYVAADRCGVPEIWITSNKD